MMTSSRNKLLDIYRIIFALIVVFVHSNPFINDIKNYYFCGGYLSVEFFAIVTGFFCTEKALNFNNDSNKNLSDFIAEYTLKEYLKIISCLIPATLLTIIIYKLFAVPVDIVNMLSEISLLQAVGIVPYTFNLPLWYVCSAIFVIPVFMYIAGKCKKTFVNIIAPVSSIAVYGYLIMTYGQKRGLDIWKPGVSIINAGILRIWAGLCMGACAVFLVNKLKTIKFTSLGNKFIKSAEIFSLVIVFIYMFACDRNYFDVFIVVFIVFIISVCLSGKSIFSKLAGKLKNTNFLVMYTLILYLTHWPVRQLLINLMPPQIYGYSHVKTIYIISSLLYAAFISLVVMGIKHIIKKIKFKLIQQ